MADPAIFERTFDALGRPPRHGAVMVGDNLTSDIAGGNAYEISTCWYNPHRTPPEPRHVATHEIVALDELPAIVRGQSA